jgi:hypothetical protein
MLANLGNMYFATTPVILKEFTPGGCDERFAAAEVRHC